MCFRAAKRIRGVRIGATLRFNQSDQHPGRAVGGIRSRFVGQRFQELVECTEFDMVSVDAIERGATTRRLLQHGHESLSSLKLLGFRFVWLIGEGAMVTESATVHQQ